MGKNKVILLVSAFCLLSLVGFSYGAHFTVEGKVYCDTCRTQFITKVSEYMKGAKVRMECRCMENNTVTYSVEAETDETGTYHMVVDGDHEEELCQIELVKSPDENCNEINNDLFLKRAVTVTLTTNNGIVSEARTANPLGFMRKEALPQCPQVLRELGFTRSQLVP